MDSTKPTLHVQHTMDYPSLAQHYPEPSVLELDIVGLHTKVYGLDEIKHSKRPLALMIACHGRMSSQKHMKYFVQGLLGQISEKKEERRRDLVIVTLDQRNHGTRLVNKTANLAFDDNPRHLLDMAATIQGGVHDVTLLIDFIESYLFPNGEKVVEEFIVTGISLGGHVTWKILHDDPRIRIGIPIIGLPFSSTPKYLCARARGLSTPLSWGPPTYPPALRAFLEPHLNGGDGDGAIDAKCFAGKRILSMHGKSDALVPFSHGEDELKQIRRWTEEGGGVCEVVVEEGAGHVCSIRMLRMAAEWTWNHALRG